MMSLLPDEIGLYSDCPSDVFCLLLSPILSASLKVRSLIDLFFLNKKQGPLPLKSLVLLVIRSGNQVPSADEKSQSSAYEKDLEGSKEA